MINDIKFIKERKLMKDDQQITLREYEKRITFFDPYKKQNKLFFLKDKFKKGLQEMYLYTWNDKLGKEDVKKENDDVLDALRYALFSEYKLGGAGIRIKPRRM